MIILQQKIDLALDYIALVKHKQIDRQSKISNLHLFIDTEGILRVGERLKHSLLPYNEQPSIKLSSHLAKLIIIKTHQVTLHEKNQETLGYICRKY